MSTGTAPTERPTPNAQRPTPNSRRGLNRTEKRDLLTALAFISPWIIGFCVFLAYPIVKSIYYSLCDFSVLQPPQWVGTANYTNLVRDDVFLQALYNTVYYAVFSIPLGIALGFGIALLLNTGVRGMAFYRTFFFLPSLVPAVAMGILWLWLLNGKSGIVNFGIKLALPFGAWAFWLILAVVIPVYLARRVMRSSPGDGRAGVLGLAMAAGWFVLAALLFAIVTGGAHSLGGILSPGFWSARMASLSASLHSYDPPAWLSKPEWVKPAFILMSLWGTGNAVVIYLAGLQDVPVHLYEAADLDGATWWQKVRNVTIPMMSPVLLFNGIMAIIGTFNFFAQPYVMAPGGQPARSAYFLAVDLFDNAFSYLQMGYASAMAWILFVIVFCLTMAALKLSEKHVHYGGG